MSCIHPDLCSEAEVVRAEGTGRFVIHISVKCNECGALMRFVGLPVGTSMNGASVSPDGTVARLAMIDAPCTKGTPHLRVVNTDGGPT